MAVDLSDYERRLKVRTLTAADFEAVKALQLLCFSGMQPWTREQFESQVSVFPEGQIGVELDGDLVASSSSLIVDFDLYSDWHDWMKISGGGYIRNHDPEGDMLYGIEIMVHPDHRGKRLARRLYEARKRLVRERNLKGIVIGGRIPVFAKYKDSMTAREYVRKVQDKTLHDPVLTTQLANDFRIQELIPDYLPSDEDSAGWATHMQWTNLEYRPKQKRFIQAVQRVRLGAVQYEIRPVDAFDEFAHHVDFFVDTAAEYGCDFLLFPELFTTQLLSFCEAPRPGQAARKLAEFTPQYLDLFTGLAVRYSVNIVGGSQFVVEDGNLYNASYLFRRDGTIGRQRKLHVTPAEWKWWGVRGGEGLEVFQTDCGRVAILVCYDIEFPEAARAAAKQGAQIVFCPFNTQEINGFLRVRTCARARAIENHLYVVTAGAVGNLPDVANADVHYAQSSIFTPVDIAFPRDGIAAECPPNAETIVLQDLDVELLRRHRYEGTTTNWRDRRTDLFETRWKKPDGEWKTA